MDPKTYRYTDLSLLHPIARARFQNLDNALKLAFIDGKTTSQFMVFETYRHPLRQQWLKQTTQHTKAGPFEGSHNFGLAVDFVPVDRYGKWTWSEDEDWDFLKVTAMQHGLIVPYSWDRPHVEHPIWAEVFDTLKVRAAPPKKIREATAAIWREHDEMSKGA